MKHGETSESERKRAFFLGHGTWAGVAEFGSFESKGVTGGGVMMEWATVCSGIKGWSLLQYSFL